MVDVKITLNPLDFRAFGEVTEKNDFVLVTNDSISENFELVDEGRYGNLSVISYDDSQQDFSSFLEEHTKDCSHVLTVCPDSLITSVPREVLQRRKLLIMACRSGKTPMEGIKHFLELAGKMDVEAIQASSDALFNKGQDSEQLVLVDQLHNLACTFNHLNEDYEWHEQVGYLEEGDQQVFPSGEVACFLVPLYTDQLPDRQFDLNGKLVMTGPAVVQSGPPSFLLEDQLNIYQELEMAKNGGVELDVVQGRIVGYRAIDESAEPAVEMLNHLFAVDSRYRNIYEVGFSMNNSVRLWPGNTAMNEVWGENGGNIHIGIGMLPYTQYHIDIFCANTVVKNDRGDIIFGASGNDDMASTSGKTMKRVKAAACPCNTAV